MYEKPFPREPIFKVRGGAGAGAVAGEEGGSDREACGVVIVFTPLPDELSPFFERNFGEFMQVLGVVKIPHTFPTTGHTAFA